MSKIDNLIKTAEQTWLVSYGQGPKRTRWTKLPLQVGDQAPDVQLLDATGKNVNLHNFWQSGPALLIFLRHYGCSCAHDRTERLAEEYADYIRNGATVVAIGQGEPERSAAFAKKKKLPCLLLSDPDRIAYQAYDLLEGVPSQVSYGMADVFLKCDMEAAAEFQDSRRGTDLTPVDNPWQLPGDFVVNQNGIINLAYRSQFCADFPDKKVLIAAIKEAKMEVTSSAPI